MGFFTDTTVCIGCKACEVACKQWNDLPADGSQFKKGGSYDHTGELSASTWRHVRFVEMLEPSPQLQQEAKQALPAIPPAGELPDLVAMAESVGSQWLFMSDVCKHCTNAGCLDACPTGALIRTEYQTGRAAAGRVQRMRPVRAGMPVRSRRPRPPRRAGREVHALLRPLGGRPRAGVRQGVPHRLDRVRASRGARRARRAPGRDPAPPWRGRGVPLRRRRRARPRPRRRPRGVLPADRAARALRPAGRGGVARPGEPVRRDGRGRRRRAARGGRRRVDVRDRTEGAGERATATDGHAAPTRDTTPALGTRGRAGLVAAGGRGRARGASRDPHGATRPGPSSTATTPATAMPSPRTARSRRRIAACATERCPTICAGRSSRRRCGPGRFRSTSGSAGWPRARRSSRWPPTSRATSGRPRVARKVALAAVLPAPALLIADLGRPARFLNMLRIFKPRSPMNMGAWCLVAFTGVGAGAVGADLLGRPRTARRLGAVNALLGGYLGSYTGVLLAATAVPVWARSRIFLGPIFVSTATATGAAATRLTMAAAGPARGPPDPQGARPPGGRRDPHRVDALDGERAPPRARRRGLLAGQAAPPVSHREAARRGRAGTERARPAPFQDARRARGQPPVPGRGLAFRFAWVEAGKASARDDEAVALVARGRATADEHLRSGTERRALSDDRPPLAPGAAVAVLRAWSRTVGRREPAGGALAAAGLTAQPRKNCVRGVDLAGPRSTC